MNRRLRVTGVLKKIRSKKHHVKGAEKAVLRKEKKDSLKLKSKVHGLLR
jgi:hypothetical protein